MTDFAEGDACEFPAVAVCWLADEPQPGMVLVELSDVHGRPHQLVGKTAYFEDGVTLQSSAAYPMPVDVRCAIDKIDGGVATVSTWWVSDRYGNPFVFELPLDTLTPVSG